MPKSAATRRITMPSTLARSSPQAQRTYAQTLKAAEDQYGPGERAARTAYASLKHGFEKVGGHWERKARPGPSDPHPPKARAGGGVSRGETFGGVDVVGHTKRELYERARELGVAGRSTMDKQALARAIAKKQG